MNQEKKVVVLLQNQDESAFDYIYNKYVRLVYHVIYSIVENVEDTKDLIQDTFLKMMRVINSFNPNNNFKFWLITIAKNKAIDFKKKEQRIVKDYDFENFTDETKEEYSDFHQLLAKYKGLINKDEYNIITLHIFHNLKFREIADVYDKSTSAVNNIYVRGIKKIKNHLKGVNQNEKC